MSLFLIVYVAGKIGGTVGPLPYGLQQCREKADRMWYRGWHDVVTSNGYTRKDISLVCEFHDERPKMEVKR